jgi:hypothetical protein
MPGSARAFAAVLLALLGIGSTAAAPIAASEGRVRGTVADTSDGVLPGVTVVATSEDGRVLATTVTDGAGRYVLDALPAAPVTITFELEGFSSAVVDLTVEPNADSWHAQRLTVAPRSETVTVYGKAPVPPPPPRRLPAPPPPPVRVLQPVPEHDRESICGPAKATAASESLGTIQSRHRFEENGLYARNDELTIDGGRLTGLEVGLNVVVRRLFRLSGAPGAPAGEHSAGLVQIVSADDRASVAVVIYACDEVMRGDFLAPFNPEPKRAPEPAGIPAFDNAARVLFADGGQMVGVQGRLMVIDRGRDHGLRAGQRLTLFRRPHAGAGAPSIVGDAVVVAVRIDSATIRVERATDVIAFGDWAAPQRHTAATAASSGVLR